MVRASMRRITAAVVVIGVLVILTVLVATRGEPGDSGDDTLADAVTRGDHDLAHSLLDAGADPDEPLVLTMTPLIRAAVRNDAEMVEILLAAGADLEATDPAGVMAVHAAAQADAEASLQALIAAGARLDARSRSGMAAFEHAASRGSLRALRLLAPLVDIDAPSEAIAQGHGPPRDIGSTPMGLAVRSGHDDAVKLLLDLGAEVDARSTAGHTPLLIAVFTGQEPELVEMLLAAGADPTVVASCNMGCAPFTGDALGWAMELGRTDLIPLLENATEVG